MNDTLPTSSFTSDIYFEYKNEISDIIAYIEVYEHDYPGKVMSHMAELFQCMANYETKTGSDKEFAKIMLDDSFSQIKQSLYIHTIWVFIKNILEHKKVFRHFKYKGVYIEGEKFADKAQSEEEEIAKEFSARLLFHYNGNVSYNVLKELPLRQALAAVKDFIKIKSCKSFRAFKKEPDVPLEFLQESNIDELKQTYEKVKSLLMYYQSSYSEVVSSGRRVSVYSVVFNIITSYLFPLAMMILTVWNIINVIKK